MEILDKLLKNTKRNITGAAEEIIKLELKREEKIAQLAEAQNKLDAHFQAMAVGNGDQSDGESLQQKVFFIEGEIKGFTEVIKKAYQEAETFAAIEIEQAENKKASMSKERIEELQAVQKEIVEECKKLSLLIHKIDGRGDVNIIPHQSFTITVPLIPTEIMGSAHTDLKQQLEAEKTGPHFTLRAIWRLEEWIKAATPKSVLDDALSKKRQSLVAQA